jgi:hypothetical protein
VAAKVIVMRDKVSSSQLECYVAIMRTLTKLTEISECL